MRLLVSVRDAEEARVAWQHGAEIVDAKEPATGALGAVPRAVLREIRAALPPAVPVSAALGDVATLEEVGSALAGLPAGLAFVKLGFRGVAPAARVERLLAEAVGRAGSRPDGPKVIAVAYADWRETGGVAPEEYPALIAAAGAAGLLIDTARKDGRALPDHLPPADLAAIGVLLRERGLLYALGGSLTALDIPLVAAARADILGVRGAVTVGGRTSAIDPARVAALAESLRAGLAPSLR